MGHLGAKEGGTAIKVIDMAPFLPPKDTGSLKNMDNMSVKLVLAYLKSQDVQNSINSNDLLLNVV